MHDLRYFGNDPSSPVLRATSAKVKLLGLRGQEKHEGGADRQPRPCVRNHTHASGIDN